MPKNKRNNMQRRTQPKRPKLMDAVDAFIAANQEVIGALAWEGFQQVGRGFVFVAIEESGSLDASYIGERDDLWAVLQPNFPEIEQLINTYNPATDVVLVRRMENVIDTATVTWETPPLVAFVRQQDQLP